MSDPTSHGFVIEIDELPIVAITYPRLVSELPQSEAERIIVAYFADLDEIVATLPAVAFVIDVRATDPAFATPAARRFLFKRNDEFDARHAGKVVAEAVVMHGAIKRGMYQAYKWMKAGDYPSQVFANVLDAKSWCKDILAKI